MRGPQLARYLVAGVGVATAVAVYMTMRERPVQAPVAGGTMDPAASVQTLGTVQVRSRDGGVAYTVEAASVKVYATEGRQVLEGVKITLEDGAVLTADHVDVKGGAAAGTSSDLPQESHAKGRVTLRAPDGVALETEEATMTDASGQVTMPGAVSFTRGRLTGSGTGGVYERDTGVFKLLTAAHVVGAAAPGSRAIDATATTLTFNRASQALLLEGQAKIQNGGDVMTADRATLYLTAQQDRFRLIEMRGKARVVPGADGDGATPDMQAADIDLAFHEGVEALQRVVLTRDAVMIVGQGAARRSIAASYITAGLAPDGKTMTSLEARERTRVHTPAQGASPQRDIAAASLVASGDAAKGLTAAQFAGGVTFVETQPGARGRGNTSERVATGQTLNLKLGGQLDDIEEAQFRDNFTFKDTDVTGDADVGIYRQAKGQLVLESARGGRRLPHAVRGDMKVDATEIIELDLGTKDVHARGDVKTVSVGTGGGRGRAADGALFNDRDPILGFATEFWFDGAASRARYRGTAGAVATLRQGEGQVAAQAIELADQTRDLTAKGTVSTVLVFDSGRARGGGPGAGRYRVTAEALNYSEQQRTAAYTSGQDGPVVMTGDDGKTSARDMVLTLARERRALDQLDARGEVAFQLAVGHEGLADALLYEADLGRYTVSGQPVVVRTKDEKPGTCEVWTGRRAYFTTGAPAPEFPRAENPGGVRTEKGASCSGALTR